MIASLRGTVLARSPRGELLVEVGGVGYRVVVTPGTVAAAGDVGATTFLHVHTHVREDALVLYGFPSLDERVCFEALIGAHGVGPAVALAILSVHSPTRLRQALLTDDLDALTLVPGIGKKTAVRLALELKSRLDLPELDGDVGARVNGGAPSPLADVRAALAGLGYEPDQVRDAVQALPDDGSTEELLRLALRSLAASR